LKQCKIEKIFLSKVAKLKTCTPQAQLKTGIPQQAFNIIAINDKHKSLISITLSHC
jgi:hypothetical protein